MNTQYFSRSKQWCRTLLVLLSFYSGCLHSANTIIVGNKTYSGSTENNSGPQGDGSATATFSTGANQIVIPTSAGLQSSNIRLQLGWMDTNSSGNSLIYCGAGGMGTPLTLESHFVDALVSADGHKLFKTNVQGLYFRMHMYNVSSFKTTSSSDIYIGDTPQQTLTLTPEHSVCVADLGNYTAVGGLVSKIDIEFYNDGTFNPNTTGSIALLSNKGYHYSVTNAAPGGALTSHSIYQTFNMGNVTLSSPTCTSAVVSGNTVQGDTVSLGEYNPKDIIDGVDGIPFGIALKNCYRVTNIEVKMTTGAPAMSAALLGNSLTAEANAANGVGVEIKGKSNSHYAEVVLHPNDTHSVYKAYVDTADTSNGIIGSGTSGTAANQTLNFVATLKQDNNQQIRGGDFKATAVFSITYP
ncbi:fimbrial protein [Escherichia sp. 94.0001]|uniref:fimbrial protein n=1 Tax=Escherichia sp. 94.0001 TaxID=2723312 RepID=UPI001593557E|nr:fimbrial protein [Escherichia sp. 94.0001]MBB2270936.1 fimbrial protein [Escherichia sp. 94.0001]